MRVVLQELPEQGKPGVLYPIVQLAGIAAVTPNEPATTCQGTFLIEVVEREVYKSLTEAVLPERYLPRFARRLT